MLGPRFETSVSLVQVRKGKTRPNFLCFFVIKYFSLCINKTTHAYCARRCTIKNKYKFLAIICFDVAERSFAHIPSITRGYRNIALCEYTSVCSRAASSWSVGWRDVRYHRRILPRKLEGASEKVDYVEKETEFLMTLEGSNLCERSSMFVLSL